MRLTVTLAVAALLAGSAHAAPLASDAEALITRYTWAGPGQEPPQGEFAPRDECGEMEGAYAFRLALADAVLGRDADALLALATPGIKLDFGGGEGHAEWRERLAAPEWRQWEALEAILPLGCAAGSEGGLILPWYFAQEPPVADPYLSMIVIGRDVPLLAEPRQDAAVIGRLSWDVVTLDPEEFDGELGPHGKVRTRGGQSGWLAEEHMRSWLDYRLIVEKGADGWKIAAFVAGD